LLKCAGEAVCACASGVSAMIEAPASSAFMACALSARPPKKPNFSSLGQFLSALQGDDEQHPPKRHEPLGEFCCIGSARENYVHRCTSRPRCSAPTCSACGDQSATRPGVVGRCRMN